MAHPRSEQALSLVLERLAPGSNVLDVGAGDGKHARAFMDAGHDVTAVDIRPAPDWWIPGDRCGWICDTYPVGRGGWAVGYFSKGYDLVWCSHVLEHLPDVGEALHRMKCGLAPDGLLVITVPPRKDEVVGGHRNLFNLGTLAYCLILAGFDCSGASLGSYGGYNLSAIVSADAEVPTGVLAELRHDAGDIETLAPYFPPEWRARQGFNGAAAPNVRWK